MADPFNPSRFLYESYSKSDSRNPATPTRSTCSPRTPGRADTLNRTQDFPVALHSDCATATAPRPDMGMRPTSAARTTNKHPDSLWSGHTIVIALCTVLVVISCYSLARAFDPSPSFPAGGLPPDIQAYIGQAVLRMSRDPVGRPDFALHANGGRVIRELTGIVRDDALILPYMDHSPNLSLIDDTRIGSCWKFPQGVGQLGFRTSEMLFPTHVTIDHIPIEIAVDIGHAPRSMALWGAIDGSSNTETFRDLSEDPSSRIPPHIGRIAPRFTANLTFVILTTFEYDIYSPNNVQTFPLLPLIVDSRMFFGVFILDIFGNWGGDATCLYRVRVHGESTLR